MGLLSVQMKTGYLDQTLREIKVIYKHIFFNVPKPEIDSSPSFTEEECDYKNILQSCSSFCLSTSKAYADRGSW